MQKRAAAGEGGAAKKARPTPAGGGGGEEGGIVVEGLGNLSEQEISGWAHTGQLSGLTVVQLKAVCKGLGLPVSGTKGDLIGRISTKFA